MTALIRGKSPSGKRVVAKKAGGALVNFKRDNYNPQYGGGGQKAPYTLPWAPPALTSPTTIKVTNATTGVYMDPTKDYIILLPGAIGNDLQATPHQSVNPSSSALTFSGGRNVVCIGGAIRRDIDNAAGQYVTSSSRFRAVRNRALYVGEWTGAFFIEGVYFGGQHLYETFNVSTTSATAKLYVQNCRVDTLCLKTPDTYGSSNHDGGDAGMQNWDGPAGGMYISHYSIKGTSYQGFFMQPAQFGSAVPAENIIQHIDLSYNDPAVFNADRNMPWPYQTSKFSKSVQMFCFSKEKSRQGPTYLSDIYLLPPDSGTYSDPTLVVAPDKSDTTTTDGFNPKPNYNATTKVVTWPGLSSWVTGDGINIGKRPGGDIVKPEYVGIGYISPGYDNAAPPVTAPTAAPTLTATAGVQSVSLSWTGVTNATSYKLYRSTSTPVTTSDALIGNNLSSQQYNDTGLAAGTAYYYGVVASNSAGSGPISSTASATPTAPVSTAGTFFSDNFNRSDGDIGPAWYDAESLYKVASNVAGVPTTSGLSTTTVENKLLGCLTAAPGTGTYSFAVDVTAASSNTIKNHPRVLVGMNSESDFSTFYAGFYIDSTTTSSRKWSLFKYTTTNGVLAGTEMAFDADSTHVAVGQTRPYTVETRLNGSTVELRVNGNLYIAYTDSSPLTGRFCGILTRQGGSGGGVSQTIIQRFDNATGKTY